MAVYRNKEIPFNILGISIIDEKNPDRNMYINPDSASPEFDCEYNPTAGKYKKALIKFEEMTPEIEANYFHDILMRFEAGPHQGPNFLKIQYLAEPFDPRTVTWNTKPDIMAWQIEEKEFDHRDMGDYCVSWLHDVLEDWKRGNHAMNAGIMVWHEDRGGPIKVERGSDKRYPFASCRGILLNTQNMTPGEGGFVPKKMESTFSWENVAVVEGELQAYHSGFPPKDKMPRQTQATITWRDSPSGAEKSKTLPGAGTTTTMPPGTFTTQYPEWKLKVTISTGQTYISPWTQLTTIEKLSTARIVRPKDTIIDRASKNEFVWNHIIATGTAQTGYDIQTSPNNASWTSLKTEKTDQQKTIIQPNTLPTGNIYWKVRTYNSDDQPGAWSPSANIIVVGAPDKPIISIRKSTPRPEIDWSSKAQVAYELEINQGQEKIVKVHRYGAERSWKSDNFLPDGSYGVRIRIQNEYGFWSDWATGSLTVKNAEYDPVQIYASKYPNAVVTISAENAAPRAKLYRNGKELVDVQASTGTVQITDQFAIGKCRYQVLAYGDNGDYYRLSNIVEVEAHVDGIKIADVRNPEWQDIRTSAGPIRELTQTASRMVGYNHYAGQARPSVEISDFTDRVYGLDVAWLTKDRESIYKFLGLMGKLVCIKTPADETLVGILNQISGTENQFITTVSATLTEVEWEDAT